MPTLSTETTVDGGGESVRDACGVDLLKILSIPTCMIVVNSLIYL
jgi:hypothetical protein